MIYDLIACLFVMILWIYSLWAVRSHTEKSTKKLIHAEIKAKTEERKNQHYKEVLDETINHSHDDDHMYERLHKGTF
jgi:choline-glycine betaine transporter